MEKSTRAQKNVLCVNDLHECLNFRHKKKSPDANSRRAIFMLDGRRQNHKESSMIPIIVNAMAILTADPTIMPTHVAQPTFRAIFKSRW